MKSPLKAVLIAAAIVVTIAALGWIGGILYWDRTLRTAMETVEGLWDAPRSSPEGDRCQAAISTIQHAGCRSLPHLVNALDESKNINFLETLRVLIDQKTNPPGDPSLSSSRGPMGGWFFAWYDSQESRRSKCESIRQWWKEQGMEYHRAWRFWTDNCRR
jgi:hypothetical protein